jgi:hypothetical protein
MGSVAGTLLCRRRIRAKDLRAPLGTIPITAEDAANAAQAEEAADGGGDDSSQRMPPRSRTGQGFGQFVKVGWLQLGALLPERDCEEKRKPSSFFLQQFQAFRLFLPKKL